MFHIVLIFPGAAEKREEILAEIGSHFLVRRLYEVEWTEGLRESNYRRLFAERKAGRSNGAARYGAGLLTAVLVQDESPMAGRTESPAGFVSANVNMVNLERRFSGEKDGAPQIYATYNEPDTQRVSYLLFHQRFEELESTESGVPERVARDLPGAGGWASPEAVFQALEQCDDYVVIRTSAEPARYDVLVRNQHRLRGPILNAGARVKGGCHSFALTVAGSPCELNLWNADFHYFDAAWVNNLFKSRVKINGYWEADRENAFFLYVYHAVLHQPSISNAMAAQADALWSLYQPECSLKAVSGLSGCDLYWQLLVQWMRRKRYRFVRHCDPHLPYNQRPLKLEAICRQLQSAAGFREVRPIMVNRYGGGGYIYFHGFDGETRMFIKWGGIGDSARKEYEATRLLYELCPSHVAAPGLFCDHPLCKFYAMEFLEGRNLRSVLDEQSLSEADKADLVAQLGSLSDALFQAGILHRDIRPENLYLTNDGTLKLIDCQWAVCYDSYTEQECVIQNPRYIKYLGAQHAVARWVWDDHFSINRVMDEIAGKDDDSPAHSAVRERIGKQELRFFDPPSPGVLQKIKPDILYETHREWLVEYGTPQQLYDLDRARLISLADEQAVYQLDKSWLEKRGDEEALYRLERSWLEKTADETAVYQLDKAWLEKHGDAEALYYLERTWLEKDC